jgi:protein-L-isoaspartate(D-aspartate) O-methyltransferase
LGYSSAVIARMAEAVVAVEENEALAAEAQRVLASEGVDNAAVIAGPLAEGCAKAGPFDAITVQGGVEEIPQALIAHVRHYDRALLVDYHVMWVIEARSRALAVA